MKMQVKHNNIKNSKIVSRLKVKYLNVYFYMLYLCFFFKHDLNGIIKDEKTFLPKKILDFKTII